MKTSIKKIIVGVFGFVLLFTAQSAFASTWNGASNDCKGISIVNASTNEGYADPCWPSSSVSADAGDTLNVRIYYHNTGTVAATNTRVVLNAPTGSSASSSKTFSGSISSDQGGLSLGSVTANLSSSQTITFNSVKWYTNNTSETLTPLLNGQSGSAILNGGLDLGSIAPGWATQGSLVVSFHVSNTTTPQLCEDPTATNYKGSLPCTYPAQLCKDPSATNYNGALPCQYVSTSTCTISSFTASDTSIESGDDVTLRWDTNGCENVKISDIGNVNNDGSETVYPEEDTTYVLTAYDHNGYSKTKSVKIYVDESNNNNSSCSIDSFTASDTYIDKGDSSILKWKTTDCDNVSISEIGNVNDDGSETVYPYGTTTYTLRAYGSNGGTRTKTIRININNDYDQSNVYNTNIVTTVATNISQTSAQINGLITNSSYNNTNVHFEYGTTINLGMRTSSTSTSGNANFSAYITNLSPNTIYYFQAVADSNNSRGAIEVFRTLGYNTNTNTNTNNTNTIIRREVIVQGNTVSGSESPIMLQISNRYQSIGVGDIVDYTVYYKNISSSRLTKPMVQVVLPAGMALTNSSIGTYSVEDRTLSAPIQDLNPGEEGTIYLQARVDQLDSNLGQIVTTAILVYTNPNGAQENAMAYVLNNPRINNLLGASAFFGNIFGFGLIGWLILIIIILLLVLIARSMYTRRNVVTTTTQKTISQ